MKVRKTDVSKLKRVNVYPEHECCAIKLSNDSNNTIILIRGKDPEEIAKKTLAITKKMNVFNADSAPCNHRKYYLKGRNIPDYLTKRTI